MFSRGSKFDANLWGWWVSFACNSTMLFSHARPAVDASSAVDYLCGRRKAGRKQNAAFSKDFIEA